jgi:hypothetical protein
MTTPSHQHGFSVVSAKPCVWIAAEESRRNDQLFAHTRFQQNVSRLSFAGYNQALGITEKKLRFMAHHDLQAHAGLVLQHLSDAHCDSTKRRCLQSAKLQHAPRLHVG